MKKNLLYLACSLLLMGCGSGDSSENHISGWNKKESVKTSIHSISIPENDAIISNSCGISTFGDKIYVNDFNTVDKYVYVFNKDDFKYLGGLGTLGEGPGEIRIPGALAYDKEKNELLVLDHGKLEIFAFDIDAALSDKDEYMPKTKMKLKPTVFPSEYVFVNDTLAYGRMIIPKGTNDFTPLLGKWNMKENKAVNLSSEGPVIPKKKVTVAVSTDKNIGAELYSYRDLISLFTLEGKLICNVYGPNWSEKNTNKTRYYSASCFDSKGNLYAAYCGNKDETFKDIQVISPKGKYLKTLKVGYNINNMCYDKQRNRIYFIFNDDIQIGYLDLKGLI